MVSSLTSSSRATCPTRAQALADRQWREFDEMATATEPVDHPSFHRADAAAELFGPGVAKVDVPAWTHFSEIPDDSTPPPPPRRKLSRDEEAQMFLRYNYARFHLARLADRRGEQPSTPLAAEMLLWYGRVRETLNDLVAANMPLVPAMAKRMRIPGVDFSELVSEGNMALLRAIDKFDVSRGFKFSTYACRAILKSLGRLASKAGRYHRRFGIEFDPKLEPSDYDVHKHAMQHARAVEDLCEVLAMDRANLTDIERRIVTERFAIVSRDGKKTLSQVGKLVGLTNERVRQIEKSAFAKIRNVLDKEYLVA